MRKEIQIAENRDFKGVWIPAEIHKDRNLSRTEKDALVEIYNLCGLGTCYASNKHFAEYLGVAKGTAANIIYSLRKKGYISIELVYKSGSKEIDKRVIKYIDTYSQKNEEGIHEKMNRGIHEKVKEKNTDILKNTKEEYKNKSSHYEKQSVTKHSPKQKFEWKDKEQYQNYLNNIMPDYVKEYIDQEEYNRVEYNMCVKHIREFYTTFEIKRGYKHPWYNKELIFKVCESLIMNYQDDYEFDLFMIDFFNKQTDKHDYSLIVLVGEEWIKMSRAIQTHQYYDFKETKVGQKNNVVSYDEYIKQNDNDDWEEWEDFFKEN